MRISADGSISIFVDCTAIVCGLWPANIDPDNSRSKGLRNECGDSRRRIGRDGTVIVNGGDGDAVGQVIVVSVVRGRRMTDNERFIHDVGIANATDGQSLCRIPVAGGEEQPAADSRGSGVAAFRHDDDAAARPGGELHGVGRGAALGHAGRHSGEAQTGTVIVLNGDGQRAADIVVAATAGGMADGDALIILVAIVDAADGDGLCHVPVAGGKGQRGRADGGGCGIAAGGGDGDAGGRFAVEDDGVGGGAALGHAEFGVGQAQAGTLIAHRCCRDGGYGTVASPL